MLNLRTGYNEDDFGTFSFLMEGTIGVDAKTLVSYFDVSDEIKYEKSMYRGWYVWGSMASTANRFRELPANWTLV